MSKYEPLWNYLIKGKKELKEYGYEVGKISMKEKTIIFNKLQNE